MGTDRFRREQAGEKPVLVALASEIEAVILSLVPRRLGAPPQGLAPAGAATFAGALATASDRAPRRISIGEAMKIEE